jgi:hypothetical protein
MFSEALTKSEAHILGHGRVKCSATVKNAILYVAVSLAYVIEQSCMGQPFKVDQRVRGDHEFF